MVRGYGVQIFRVNMVINCSKYAKTNKFIHFCCYCVNLVLISVNNTRFF